MPGPAPKHPSERVRRNKPQLRQLPAEGRSGVAPSWPLPKPLKVELEVWRDLWATPQAAAWDQLGWTRSVARYCRLLVEAEKRDTPVSIQSEVRQMEDRLGLTPMSMKRLGWEIASDEVAERRSERESVRGRIQAVDPAAAG